MNIETRNRRNECSNKSLDSPETKPNESRVIKRRIRVGKKYHHIQNNIRKQLINRVEKKGERIIEVLSLGSILELNSLFFFEQVAKELNMKYSTAKSILKVYRSEGRASKIPKSQRYLSLRNMEDDYLKPAQQNLAAPKKSTQKTKESPHLALDERVPSCRGPQTRYRSNKEYKYA